MDIRFSIITPVHLWNQDRVDKFKKSIESVKNQNYDLKKIQHIIINDGSTVPFEVPDYEHIKVINQPHLERINAYNAGFKEAVGEIFVLLDSDDELELDALALIDKAYKDFPEYKMFNFGCTFIHKTGAETKRAPFKPVEKEIGHEIFGGGNIVNGTFVFSKEIYDDLGGLMPMHVDNIDCSILNYGGIRKLSASSPWDFSAYAQLKFPEIQQFFMTKHPDHPKNIVKELGDPFGQDYFLFYMYTRKYKSKPIDEYILRVNLR